MRLVGKGDGLRTRNNRLDMVLLPELAIISVAQWNKVQSRFGTLASAYPDSGRRGLLSRSLTSPYLFSNLLKCGLCGGNLIIASGGGKKPKYVCSGYFNRGICSNNLYIRQDELEERLLARLQSELLEPDSISRAIGQFGRQVRSSLAGLSDEIAEMRIRKEKLEREIRNCTAAIGESGHSKHILEEIAVREKELSAITDRLLSAAPDSLQTRIEEMKEFVSKGIEKLAGAPNENSPLAKRELHSHLSAIRMFPTEGGEGWYYIAEGTWDLLGTDPLAPIFGVPADGRIRMVAGGVDLNHDLWVMSPK